MKSHDYPRRIHHFILQLSCMKPTVELCLYVVSKSETLQKWDHHVPHFLLAIRCVFAHHFLQHHQVTIFHASAHAELVGFLLWDILKWRVDEASINGFHSSVGLDILLENLQENHEYL